MYLEGNDIIIRNYKIEDANDVFVYAKMPNIGPVAGWPVHRDIEDTKNVLNILMTTKEDFAIHHKEDNKVIGGCSLRKSKVRQNINAYEIGYVLNEVYWKKGLVNQASKLLIKEAFENLNAEIVEVYHYPHNTNSKRTIELLGFKYEGILRMGRRNLNNEIVDFVCYSMTKEEYNELLKGT